MLRLNVKSLLKGRGIKHPYSWMIANGLPVTAARNFSADSYRNVPLDYLEKLCVLLRCTPNDLLAWEPATGVDTGIQPMAKLIPDGSTGLEWMESLGAMSLEELRALGKKIAAGKEG